MMRPMPWQGRDLPRPLWSCEKGDTNVAPTMTWYLKERNSGESDDGGGNPADDPGRGLLRLLAAAGRLPRQRHRTNSGVCRRTPDDPRVADAGETGAANASHARGRHAGATRIS